MATEVERPPEDYATKAELKALEHRIDAGFAELRHAIELIAANSRTDMANLRTNMETLRTDMETLRSDQNSSMERLRTDMEALRSDQNSSMERLRTDFTDFKADIKIDVANRHNAQVKWLIGVALAAIVIILAALELIPRFWPVA